MRFPTTSSSTRREGKRIFLNRVVQRREAHQIFDALPTDDMSMAEISGTYWTRARKWKLAANYSYPDYDICVDAFYDERGSVRTFDMIIADQVWEHLDRPYAATRNVLSMLNKGGYFYIAVPFFARYHAYPVDCSRWTSRGLTNLLIESGFDAAQISADQWGNLKAARRDVARRWAKHQPTDDLANDPNFPIVSWALARR